jgi:hypothetical protein
MLKDLADDGGNRKKGPRKIFLENVTKVEKVAFDYL